MKTYCKHSRITEPAFVRDCIERFLNGKRSRRDVNDFLSRHPDLDSLSWQIADEIGRGEYRFAPIRYFRRVEPISGKIRIIGRESIRHQIYDYVCGTALMPLFRAKVGRWQTASVPGRGTADARRAIKRWVREPSSKVFVKLDVRKCYPSISREVLKRLLLRDLTIAVKRIRAYLHDTLRLEIHPTWNVKHVGVEPIDMVGFTFYPDHTGVRAGIFLRARRSFRRYARNPTSLRLAYRCASYYGWLKNSDSIQYRRRNNVDQIVRRARNTVAASRKKG